MKKNLLIFVIAFIGFIGAIAQTTPSSATWPLSSVTTTSVTTSGQVNANIEAFKNTEVNGYTGVNGSQRVRMAGTGNTWPANLTYQLDTVYIQFAITVKAGNILYVDSIGMGLAASSSSTFEANVYYSKNTNFSNPDTIRHVASSSNNYLSTSAIANVYKKGLNVVVNEGETLYVRVYPWHEAASIASGKYLNIQNVKISGYTESLPVPSAITWPETSNLTTNVVTGNIIAGTPTLSSLSNYGTLAYGGVNGVSVYTNAVWQTESAPAEGRYVQFSASPKTGGTLVIDSFTMKLAAWATNDFRVSVYYSKDPNFTLATGNLAIADAAVVASAFTKFKGTFSITVNTGETVYIRLYPYHLSTSGDKWKLVGMNDISVYGKVTGVTADPPTLTTTAISDISTTYVATGGTISSDGGASVTERGVCWNITGTPTISDNKTSDGTGSGIFKSVPKTLTANTTYYLRAYATNTAGTAYGNEVTFTTLASITVPTISTNAIGTIMAMSAKSGGSISAWGGDTIKSKGICWNTTGSPTVGDSKSNNGTGIAAFNATLYPLSQTTTYYVRAYATNSAGTGYGNEVSFTTQAIAPDVVKIVSKDGTGHYTTVQAAFDGVTDNYTGRWMIYVKPGTYKEKLILGQNKVNVILYGMHPDSVILTYDDYAGKSNGAGGTLGTSGSYSVAIEPDDFTAMNITFQNTQKNDGSTGTSGEQAVALRTNGDRQQFYNCKITGYQDTYYAWGGRAIGRNYFKKCLIAGSVDYIFGRNVCVFDSSIIHTNRNGGCVTAPSTEATSKFGFVFLNDSLTHDITDFNGNSITSIYLGRPWQQKPQCVYIKSYEPAVVAPAGWTSMSVNPLLFAEYQCYGPGFSPATRSTVPSSAGRQLTDQEALAYTIPNIFAMTTDPAFGYDWIPVKPLVTIPGGDVKVKTINGSLVMSVFPNPASEFITVQRNDSKITNLAIYDMKGSKVITQTLKSGSERIDISRLRKGIYIVVVNGTKTKITVK